MWYVKHNQEVISTAGLFDLFLVPHPKSYTSVTNFISSYWQWKQQLETKMSKCLKIVLWALMKSFKLRWEQGDKGSKRYFFTTNKAQHNPTHFNYLQKCILSNIFHFLERVLTDSAKINTLAFFLFSSVFWCCNRTLSWTEGCIVSFQVSSHTSISQHWLRITPLPNPPVHTRSSMLAFPVSGQT